MDTIHHDWAREQSRHVAGMLIRLRRERVRHLLPVDGTGPAWHLMVALMALGSDEHLCVGDLAEHAAVPRTTTVRWLRELDKHGFVTLTGDKKDKRTVRVRLTPAGQRAVDASFDSAGLGTRR